MSGPPPKPAGTLPSASELQQKLSRARTKLLLRYPFFGYLVSNLDDKLGAETQTAATDGASIRWSSEFLARISEDDAMFVLAHESLHCALQHLWRRGGRDKERWDLACDAAVNDMLLEGGLSSALPMFRGAKGRAAEAVYEDIPGLLKANGVGSTLDDHGGWEESDAGDPASRDRSDAWKAALARARSFGDAPEQLKRFITDLLEPKRDWRDLLRQGLFFPEDYRWVPTDRRFPDVLMPTLTGEAHRVVIAVDTSGSIEGETLGAFWTELVAILRNNRCEARVIACDAAIQNEWDEADFDPARVRELKGGGGTSFVPVFERVEQYIALGWRPEAVVYLTDLEGTFPNGEPELRTIWVVEREAGTKKPPFGEVIALD